MPGVGRPRVWALAIIAGLIPLGLASKLYAGPGAAWAHSYLGGVVYVVFWCMAAFCLWPRTRAWRIAAWVLGLTCALEVMQLWQPPCLQALRGTFLGAALLGTTFAWWDFAYYVLAAVLAWALMLWLQKRGRG